MPNVLSKLISDANARVDTGYYAVTEVVKHDPVSFKSAIRSAEKNAIIAEIKPISPALGPLRPNLDPVDAAVKLARGGAIALSILTEPDNFGGNLAFLQGIRPKVTLPLMMKDIIIDKVQIQAGRKSGADCILLIETVFSKHSIDSRDDLIQEAHQNGLEVLLEAHSEDELDRAMKSDAEIIGINNRDLTTLETDLGNTTRLLESVDRRAGKILISESGFETADDIRKMKLVSIDGFLIGSSIMLSQDLESKVREFVDA